MKPIKIVFAVCAASVIAIGLNSEGGGSLFAGSGSSGSGGAKFVSVGQKSSEPGPSLKGMVVDLIQRFHGREEAKRKDLAGLRARRSYEASHMSGLTAADLTGKSYEQVLIDQAASKLRGEERRAQKQQAVSPKGSVGYLR